MRSWLAALFSLGLACGVLGTQAAHLVACVGRQP